MPLMLAVIGYFMTSTLAALKEEQKQTRIDLKLEISETGKALWNAVASVKDSVQKTQVDLATVKAQGEATAKSVDRIDKGQSGGR